MSQLENRFAQDQLLTSHCAILVPWFRTITIIVQKLPPSWSRFLHRSESLPVYAHVIGMRPCIHHLTLSSLVCPLPLQTLVHLVPIPRRARHGQPATDRAMNSNNRSTIRWVPPTQPTNKSACMIPRIPRTPRIVGNAGGGGGGRKAGECRWIRELTHVFPIGGPCRNWVETPPAAAAPRQCSKHCRSNTATKLSDHIVESIPLRKEEEEENCRWILCVSVDGDC